MLLSDSMKEGIKRPKIPAIKSIAAICALFGIACFGNIIKPYFDNVDLVHNAESSVREKINVGYDDFFIPDNIPGFLTDAIEEHADFNITLAEEKMVSRYDPLIKYFSSIDYFNNSDDIDPAFPKALIAVESRGETKAKSNKYARGLSQIKFYRARTYGERILDLNLDIEKIATDVAELGFDSRYLNEETLNNLKSKHLHDPAINILFLCYGISENSKKFGNRIDLNCAEWNAGYPKGIICYKIDGKRIYVANDIAETNQHIGRINALYNLYKNKSDSLYCQRTNKTMPGSGVNSNI